MSSWWCWRIGPQKWWKLRQRSRRPPKNISGILRDPERDVFWISWGWIDLHFWAWVSGQPWEVPDHNHRQSVFARSTVRDAKISNMLCGSVLYHFTSFESFTYSWSQCLCLSLGLLVSRAHCWRQLMPRTGTRQAMVVCDDFSFDPYDPAWSTLKHSILGTIERFQALDSQVFFHRHPFARESLQLSPSTAWIWFGSLCECVLHL